MIILRDPFLLAQGVIKWLVNKWGGKPVFHRDWNTQFGLVRRNFWTPNLPWNPLTFSDNYLHGRSIFQTTCIYHSKNYSACTARSWCGQEWGVSRVLPQCVKQQGRVGSNDTLEETHTTYLNSKYPNFGGYLGDINRIRKKHIVLQKFHLWPTEYSRYYG